MEDNILDVKRLFNTDTLVLNDVEEPNQDPGRSCESETSQTVVQEGPKSQAEAEDGFADCQDEEEDIYNVNLVRSKSTIKVLVSVNGVPVEAVVDTAAQITILSDRLMKKLDPQPSCTKNISLQTAGRKLKIQGKVTEPLTLRVGKSSYLEEVVVAPIEDEMLLGLDFMVKHEVNINIPEATLMVEGEEIPLSLHNSDDPPKVSRLTVKQRQVIPPNSVGIVACKGGLPGYFMVEPDSKVPALIPRTLQEGMENTKVCLVNTSDRNVVLKRKQVLGLAHEVSLAVPIDDNAIRTLRPDKPSSTEADQTSNIPEHIKDMLKQSEDALTADEHKQLTELLVEYSDVFAENEYDLGNFTEIEHSIDTGNAKPIRQRMRRTPACFVDEEKSNLEKMIKAGVIEPSTSEWASAPVLIRKRDGSVRWCVDYRALNSVTIKDVFPLPLIEECLDTLAENACFSKLDANSAYWQVRVKEADRKKTAFVTKYGLFEFVKMGFGLCNAPATYSRVMNLVLRGLNWATVLAFLDDILVMGRDFLDHLKNLENVFQRFRQYGLKLKPKKCAFFQKEVEFLGRRVGPNGLQLGNEQIKAVQDWPTPTSSKEVEQFLGLVNYHRIFLKNYADLAVPLYQVTGKQKFRWEPDQDQAFQDIKTLLTQAPVLALPNRHDPFILDTDASDKAIGAEIIQVQEGVERVIAYGSMALSAEQRAYCTTRKELLAVVRFTRQYRHYLLGRQFTVRTDHNSLTWLLNFKDPQGQLARWIEELSQYDMIIRHRPGKKHGNADALSRIPDEMEFCPFYRFGFEISTLPCGGCSYCQRAQKNWGEFVESVDEAVPLSNKSSARNQQVCKVAWDDAPCISNHLQIDMNQEIPEITVYSLSANGDVTTDFHAEQGKDADLKILIAWFTQTTSPTEAELFLASPTAKYYWLNKDLFEFRNGILWEHQGRRRRLVVPMVMQPHILEACHNLPSVGHQGEDRTRERVKERYFWHGLTKSVKQFVQSCEVCNRQKKPNRHAKMGMTSFHAGAPMERVHLDFLGPLPKTPKGNEYILVMVDQFTKWVECVALPSQNAETTAHAAVSEFFSRFGYPLQIHTDRGSNFESQLFQSVCQLLQVHKTRTTPYRPSANGQVERFNRTLLSTIRCFIGNQKEWDRFLPQLAGALRSAVNRNTGFTPNKLMLGREVNIPADLMFPADLPTVANPDEYIQELENATLSAHKAARDNLKTAQMRMKRDYDLKILEHTYAVGDVVYVLDTAVVKGKCRKLSPPWKGPGIILEKISAGVYRVKVRNSVFTTNHDRLKLCKDREFPSWIAKLRQDPGLLERALKESKDQETEDLVYCVCRKPDNHTLMIQCDECLEWFHVECVGMTKLVAKRALSYKCPDCQRDLAPAS